MKRKAAAIGWLPVLGLITVLFALPSSEVMAARAATLTVPHKGQYGGELAHWVANGLPANKPAHLQRRGAPGAAWADVDDSFRIGTTNARGHLEFDFHTPAMNQVYFRVVTNGGGATAQVLFETELQDAEVTLVENNPVPGAPLVQSISEGRAVNGETFTFKADTAYIKSPAADKPVLQGRGATLERRTIKAGLVTWDDVATGAVAADGIATFPNLTGGRELPAGSYRVRLADWTKNGDDIGWFLSFPFEVSVYVRPLAVLGLVSNAVSDSRVDLRWRLPADSRDKIVVTRSTSGPADLNDFRIATLPGSTTSYSDTSVFGSTHYYYAVYSVSAAGIYTRLPATTDVTTPAPPTRGEG